MLHKHYFNKIVRRIDLLSVTRTFVDESVVSLLLYLINFIR
jgi:hypothetical protein